MEKKERKPERNKNSERESSMEQGRFIFNIQPKPMDQTTLCINWKNMEVYNVYIIYKGVNIIMHNKYIIYKPV